MQSILSLFLLVAAGGIQVINGQNSTEPSSEQYRICGLNYTEVLGNCNTNPTCPSGDSCPVGYICYQLNAALCPPPTSAPSTGTTAAPSSVFATAYNVCAASFSEAANLCFNTTKTCETCNNATEACFTVLPNQCTTGGETDAPTTPQVQTEPPSASSSVASSVPPTTAKPSLSPTTAPNRFFCARSWDTVDETCSTATPCPNGQQDCTTAGMTCYQIQADKCVGTSTSTPTSPNRFFCATSWDTVDETCSTATPCPNGQQDCTTAGMTCYQIQADECVGTSTSSPTVGANLTSAPSPSSGFGANSTSAPSPSPSVVNSTIAPTAANLTSAPTAANSSSTLRPSPESSFISKAPTPPSSFGGANLTMSAGSTFAMPNSSPSPPMDGPYGFSWTTSPPNGSSTLIRIVDLKTILAAVVVLGAALALF